MTTVFVASSIRIKRLHPLFAERLSNIVSSNMDVVVGDADGADTSMLHAVDAGDESKMAIGKRVVPRWADAPSGGITDLACFELEDA